MVEDWKTFAVTNRIRSFCVENPTNNGNATIIAMLLKEFKLTISTNQVAGAVRRLGIERGGYRKPASRGPEEMAWTNPRLPEMLTQHGRLRENGLIGTLARHKKTSSARAPLVERIKVAIETPIARPNPGVRAAQIANLTPGHLSPFDNAWRPIKATPETRPDMEVKRKLVADGPSQIGPSMKPCQWPVRDGSVVIPWVMCGIDRDGWPYCSAHKRRAWSRTAGIAA